MTHSCSVVSYMSARWHHQPVDPDRAASEYGDEGSAGWVCGVCARVRGNTRRDPSYA